MNLESFNNLRITLHQYYLRDVTGILYVDHYKEQSPEVQAQLDAESPLYKRLFDECVAKSRPKGPPIAWVTVNPKEGTPISTVLKLCDNIVKKKWVKNVHYSLEQRGKTPSTMGTGIHVHFLFKGSEKPVSQIHREIFNTVKNYVGNKLHVKVQVFDESYYDDKYQYLLGNKWDSDKTDSINQDKIWREQNNIKNIYSL